jgi:outer membrane protein
MPCAMNDLFQSFPHRCSAKALAERCSAKRGYRAALIAVAILPFGGVLAADAPLTFAEVLRLAVEHSAQIAAADAAAQTAGREADVSRRRFAPTVSTGTGAQYTSGFPLAPGGNVPALFDIAYSQTIFNAPATAEARAAGRRADAHRLSAAGVRDAVIEDAAAAYLELVSVRRSLDVGDTALRSADALVAAALERQAEGRALVVDVLRARLAAARARERRLGLAGRAETLETTLRQLTGLPEDRLVDIAMNDAPLDALPAVAELVAGANRSDADLRALEAQRDAAAEHVSAERAARWPTVELVGNYAVLGRFNNYDVFFRSFQRNNINAGVQASVPLVMGGRAAAIALASSQVQEAEHKIRLRRDELSATVRQRAQQLAAASAARDVAALERDIAVEQRRIIGERAAEGRASRADIASAALDEQAAQAAFFQTTFEQQKADLALRRAAGIIDRLVP